MILAKLPGGKSAKSGMRRRTVARESMNVLSPFKHFHSALGFRFPLPRAGEGQGEGVAGRSSLQHGSLALALSQRERERMHEHWRKAFPLFKPYPSL